MIRRLKMISFLVVLVGFAALAGTYKLGFELWPPTGLFADGRIALFPAGDAPFCFKQRALALVADRGAEQNWQACKQYFARYRALAAFDWRADAVFVSGVIGLLALLGFALCIRLERPHFKVVRGAHLHTGSAGLKGFSKACRNECKVHGCGLELLPNIAISRDRETRHFLILGSVGGGKTQTMLNLMARPLARGDGLLVLDTKGDMMAGLPGNPDVLLIAPHDQRSWVWDVAADCCVKQDARELAARFIPASTDPMWSQAAQEIFVACIAHLQETMPRQWGWADLEAVVNADIAMLTQYAHDHNPSAVRLLNQPDSKTTLSILTTFQTHMRIVSVLAEAWPDNSANRFSIRHWLHNPPPHCPLILQHDPGYPELSRVWIGSMLGLLASAVGSPTLSESTERRIWLFLDEFPQLPVIKRFPTFLELGRSKGIAVVIGAQDTAQIRAVYGPDQTKAWFGMTGTKIITRINTSEAAEDISRMIGDQEIERRTQSSTRSGGRFSVTEAIQRELRRVITASELGSRLGPTKDGVRVLVLGLGDAVYELDLAYITLPKLRAPIIPADWTHMPPEPRPPTSATGKGRPLPSFGLNKDLADRIRQIMQ
ncbi:MAG: type IV secretion system DNA-binding domain-containing protein [Rhizomicrobium sp.]|nr:type IV secretion system DNA-binding domain-containing protein [Rhizomicrobium sp.]